MYNMPLSLTRGLLGAFGGAIVAAVLREGDMTNESLSISVCF
jgi:hypothetical protein